jgi:hypothetical protein
VATDCIAHLAKTKHVYDRITTWVDRLSRKVNFMHSRASNTAVDAAKSFYENIFTLHGLPDEIFIEGCSKDLVFLRTDITIDRRKLGIYFALVIACSDQDIHALSKFS